MNTYAAITDDRLSPAVQNENLLLACSQTLLSGIASSILVLSPSGHIVYANKAAQAMIGRSTHELARLELSALFVEDMSLRQPSVDAGNSSRRGRLNIVGNAQLPVRIDISSLQSDSGFLQGSVVTIEDLSDLLQMDEFVKQMMRCDPLTGLPKEDTLAASLETALMQLHTAGSSFALLELNIDQFRRIKESLGHDASSSAIREIAARLIKSVHKGDIVSRNTSDSFTILLTSCTSERDALDRANAVLEAFRRPFRFGPYCTNVTASIGMSFSRPGTVSSAGFSTEAELALRRCKALGGNRVVSFEPSMADWHSYAVQMESQMKNALVNEEFYVVYQPQVCCQTGRLIGVESLLRWKSPTTGLVMPATFIPAAEESGLIVQLGEWCLRAACKEVVELQRKLGYPVRLAVNVSPKQIYSSGFKDFVRQTLTETGLSPDLLELEITEGLLISHEDEAVKAINSIQELGISVAMDDFGMGFSNLSYINRFKIDRLKIDRSFISRCPEDHNSRMITTSLVFLAKSLGIEVVAEGVETPAQAALLAELRCDLAQGYLYSRPTTAVEILTLASSGYHPTSGVPASTGQVGTTQPTLAAATDPSAPTGASAATAVPAPDRTAAISTQITPAAPPVPVAENSVTVPVSQHTTAPPAAIGSQRSSQVDSPNPEVVAAIQQEMASDRPAVESPVRRQQDFTAHTILVPSSDQHEPAVTVHATSSEARKQRRKPNPADAPLEPKEPLCRPARPQRIPGAMRIRWTAVPDSEVA